MSEYIRGLREKIGHDLIFQPTAACLIRDNDGRILLVRHGEGWWSLPAGAVDPVETPAEAARRETREEASVEVELLSVWRRLRRLSRLPRLLSERGRNRLGRN